MKLQKKGSEDVKETIRICVGCEKIIPPDAICCDCGYHKPVINDLLPEYVEQYLQKEKFHIATLDQKNTEYTTFTNNTKEVKA